LHTISKHSELHEKHLEDCLFNIITVGKFMELSKSTLEKLITDDCFPEQFRQSYNHSSSFDEGKKILKLLSTVLLSYSGDNEKFHIQFNKLISDLPELHGKFGKLQSNLFVHELANTILAHFSNKDDEKGVNLEITEKELSGLQYTYAAMSFTKSS